MDQKFVAKSMTMLGLILNVLVTFGPNLGLHFTSDDAHTVTAFVDTCFQFVGWAMIAWGRWRIGDLRLLPKTSASTLPMIFLAVMSALGALMIMSGAVKAEIAQNLWYEWGGSVGDGALRLDLVSCDSPCLAKVVFHNHLVVATGADDTKTFLLQQGPVIVNFQMGDGRTPDLMSVIAPTGYAAFPPEVYVSEDETGQISILPYTGA